MATKTVTWRNRIVGHGDEPLDQILFNPANWRVHPKAQQVALEGVLSEVGWVQDVIVNRTTGHLIDGHLRCQVAMRNGETTIPVVYVELTEDEEAIILASLDPLAAMAATDKVKLEELLHQVHSDDERVQQMMEGLGVRMGIIPAVDYKDAWQGMPEFGQDDLTAMKSVTIHFAAQGDVDTFSELVGQSITAKTKSMWYPKKERADLLSVSAQDES